MSRRFSYGKGDQIMKRLWVIVVLLPLAIAAGCATRGERVPTDIEAVTTHDFNATDLQIIGGQAVKKLFKITDEQEVFPLAGRPVMYVARIRNLTDEHIDTTMISEYVETKVSESGKVRLVDRSAGGDEALEELQFQQGAFVDPTTTKNLGKILGADYLLVGSLSNLVAKAGARKGQYFLFTLTLVNVETNEAWKSQVEIQKVSKRGWFGW